MKLTTSIRAARSAAAVGLLTQFMTVGAFADNDFSKEYALAYPNGVCIRLTSRRQKRP